MFAYSLGFGLFIGWVSLFYYYGPLTIPLCNAWGYSSAEMFVIYCGTISLTFFIIFRVLKVVSLINKRLVIKTCCVLASCTSFLVCYLPDFVNDPPGFILTALTIVGAGVSAFIITTWLEVLSFTDFRRGGLMVGIAMSIAWSAVLIGGFINFNLVKMGFFSFPIISMALLLKQKKEKSVFAADYPKRDTIGLFPAKLILLVALIFVSGGIMLRMIAIEEPKINIYIFGTLAYILVCPVLGLFIYFRENVNLQFMYRLTIALALIGFFLFSIHHNDMLAVCSFLLLNAGSAVLNMYAFLLFPYMARFSTRPASVCAYSEFVIVGSQFVGHILATQISVFLVQDSGARMLAVGAGVVLAVAVFIFPENSDTFAGWQISANEREKPGHEEQCEVGSKNEVETNNFMPNNANYIPDPYAHLPLSSREKEVLVLLLKGRSGRFIGEHLNISANTVKFHISNIYSKLYVSDRQELLTRFEGIGSVENQQNTQMILKQGLLEH